MLAFDGATDDRFAIEVRCFVPDADLTQLAHVEFLERLTNCCCDLLAVAEYARQYVLKLVIGEASSA